MGMQGSPVRSCLLFSLGLVLSALAGAQPYPSKPIHLILPQTAGTPDAIVTRLNTEIVRVFRDPKFMEFLDSLATEGNVGTPQEFAAMMKSEYQVFGQMVKLFNITPE